MQQTRIEQPRFVLGDRVAVIPPAMSRHVGSAGEVVGILMNPRSATLDKYTVLFNGAEEQVFWDVQLERQLVA